MGRPSWTSRLTVEECLFLDLASSRWYDSINCPWQECGTGWITVSGEKLGRIHYTILKDADGMAIHIPRQFTPLCSTLRHLEDSVIPFTCTRPHLGGKRHWFLCPIKRNGERCGRRVGRLYLPPGANTFGCRHCYDLTYTSTQTHDQRKCDLARYPGAWDSAFESPKWSRRFLATGALLMMIQQQQRASQAIIAVNLSRVKLPDQPAC